MKLFSLQPDQDREDLLFLGEISSEEEFLERIQPVDLLLRLERAPNDFLEIEMTSKGNGFEISCQQGDMWLESYISNSLTHSSGVTIEEFVHDYFRKNLLDKYAFGELPERQQMQNDVQADFKADFNIFRTWFWIVIPVFLILLTAKGRASHLSDFFGVFIAIAIMFVPGLLLLLQYYSANRGTSIYIDKNRRTLLYTKNGITTTIPLSSISKAWKVNAGGSPRSPFDGWGYLMLEVGDKDRYAITTFLCNDLSTLATALRVKPVSLYPFYPLIHWRRKSDAQIASDKSEYELKVQEFKQNYSKRSKEELQRICNNPQEYADYAREAAKQLLKKFH